MSGVIVLFGALLTSFESERSQCKPRNRLASGHHPVMKNHVLQHCPKAERVLPISCSEGLWGTILLLSEWEIIVLERWDIRYVNLVREILHFLVLSELDSALPELILLALVSW